MALNQNPNPNLKPDGNTSAPQGALISGKDSLGNQQDIAVDTDGQLQIDVLSGAVTVTPSTASATLSNVSSSASNVTLLAANASRKGAAFFNDSTAFLYLKLAATATSSSYTVKMGPSDYYELPNPVYTGIIDGIWASANGAVRVTEFT